VVLSVINGFFFGENTLPSVLESGDKLCLVYIADTHGIRLSCLVHVGGVNRIGDKSRLSATGNFEIEHVCFSCSFSSLIMR